MTKILQAIHDEVNALGGRPDQANSYDQGIVDTVAKVLDIIERRQADLAAQSVGEPPTAREPVAYLHTLHMELGQTQRRLTWTEPSPFGIPRKHYSEEHTTSCTPLYAALSVPPGDQASWQPIETLPRDGRWVLAYRPLAMETGDETIAVVKATKHPTRSPQGVKHWTSRWCHPTHWMDIQPPPALASEVKKP